MNIWEKACALLVAAFLWVGLVALSGAGTVSIPFPGPGGVVAAGKTLTWVGQETSSGGCTSPCTFNNAGAHYNTAAGTYTHVVIWGQKAGMTFTSATICGVAGTSNINSAFANAPFAILTANVASATCDIVATFNMNPGRDAVSVFYSTGLSSAAASSTSQNLACASLPTSCSTTVTALAGGFTIAAASYQNGGTGTTWSGGVSTNFAVNIGAGAINVSSASSSGNSGGSLSPAYSDSAGVAAGINAAAF